MTDRARFQAEADRIDQLSKTRALTETESLELERFIALAEGRRVPSGLNKALARRGVKRAMHGFAR